jgi:hypothetical protein
MPSYYLERALFVVGEPNLIFGERSHKWWS